MHFPAQLDANSRKSSLPLNRVCFVEAVLLFFCCLYRDKNVVDETTFCDPCNRSGHTGTRTLKRRRRRSRLISCRLPRSLSRSLSLLSLRSFFLSVVGVAYQEGKNREEIIKHRRVSRYVAKSWLFFSPLSIGIERQDEKRATG